VAVGALHGDVRKARLVSSSPRGPASRTRWITTDAMPTPVSGANPQRAEFGDEPRQRAAQRPALRAIVGVMLDPPALSRAQLTVDELGHTSLCDAVIEALAHLHGRAVLTPPAAIRFRMNRSRRAAGLRGGMQVPRSST